MSLRRRSFEEWDEMLDEVTQRKLERDLERSGGLLANNYFERLNALIIAWDTTETTKSLIKVTWVLALATISLGFVNIFY